MVKWHKGTTDSSRSVFDSFRIDSGPVSFANVLPKFDDLMDAAAVERPCSRDDAVNNMAYHNSSKGFFEPLL